MQLFLLLGALWTPQLQAAERIVTLSPHLAELVCAAGGCDRLVGVVAYSDYPPHVRQLPQVGDAFAVNAEQLIALKPDRVLAWEGGTPREVSERLRVLKLPVTQVTVRGLNDIADALRRLGEILGTQPVANRAATEFERRLQALRKANAGVRPLRVLYHIELEPMFSVNRASPISEAIELCGGVNVFAGMTQLSAVVGKESVLAAKPEVIVFASEDGESAVRAWWARWPQLAAVERGAIYAMDGNLLTRATPRMLDGVEQLCAALSDARAKTPSR
jgi:iron complex transport system substrate-binding protein